ncbi:uncharacterized protein LOC126888861 [Diabrotica virgifera virgifera]|uniref:Secreted protein n=1 Tax=Diabrotica virgifera virgifera TaxID=50390 RepID=A0ABM5KST1_DIAVI|nr:uncharacterized protein LOC126888861 [Diabrotica virgifera virgifera]
MDLKLIHLINYKMRVFMVVSILLLFDMANGLPQPQQGEHIYLNNEETQVKTINRRYRRNSDGCYFEHFGPFTLTIQGSLYSPNRFICPTTTTTTTTTTEPPVDDDDIVFVGLP